jgi:hypothetical protein
LVRAAACAIGASFDRLRMTLGRGSMDETALLVVDDVA